MHSVLVRTCIGGKPPHDGTAGVRQWWGTFVLRDACVCCIGWAFASKQQGRSIAPAFHVAKGYSVRTPSSVTSTMYSQRMPPHEG